VTPSDRPSRRLLSIGEFAAATQLSPKALRLYDDQGLLQPATTDPASGYRYYRSDQVALGRLVRTLREMSVPLAEVARVVAARGTHAERLLAELARDVDQRYAREKRAFQTALLLLRDATRFDAVEVEDRMRPAMRVLVRSFTSNRRQFHERWRWELDAAHARMRRVRMQCVDTSYCRLVEPLSDEDAPLELLIPVATQADVGTERAGDDFTVWDLPPARCAAIDTATLNVQGADFTAPLDAIFDWLDRRGARTVDVPWLSHETRGAERHSEISWAFEDGTHATR